jgi:hypothetical protein
MRLKVEGVSIRCFFPRLVIPLTSGEEFHSLRGLAGAVDALDDEKSAGDAMFTVAFHHGTPTLSGTTMAERMLGSQSCYHTDCYLEQTKSVIPATPR